MKRTIDTILFSTCKRIKEANLNISYTAFVLSEYLYPKLELGLTFYSYSSQDLKLWDTTIQHTIFHHKNGPHITRLPLITLITLTTLITLITLINNPDNPNNSNNPNK
jgi:hypothetical protein